MQDPAWKLFASANAFVIGIAVMSKAWSQDPSLPPAPVTSGRMAAQHADGGDPIERACVAEARKRGAYFGAVDVRLREILGRNQKSAEDVTLRARVEATIRKKNGKTKIKRLKFKCDSQSGVVSAFTYY